MLSPIHFQLSFLACGEFDTINPGTTVRIHSSNYPAKYNNDEYCVWAIVCQGTNQPLTMNITNFELQVGAGCHKDYLVIKDGTKTNSTIIGHICGNITNLPKTIYTSTRNRMLINMHTDASLTFPGFQAIVSCPGRCDIHVVKKAFQQ